MNRLKIAQYIALVATVLSVVGGILIANNIDFGGTLSAIGVVVGLVSYIFGGFKTALKMAGKIAKWGWLIIPFPYDILSGIFSFFIGIIIFVSLPIIPVRKAYKESELN